jgi:hypothetical protein
MAHWMCTNCGYHLRDSAPPRQCPSCKLACAFNDVTCYRPECGGEANIDPLLVGFTLRVVSTSPNLPPPKPKEPASEAFNVKELFDGLTQGQISLVRALGRTEEHPREQIICNEGDDADKLYLVEDGQASVAVTPRTGVRVPISVVSPGEAFGWSSLVHPYRLTATVKAIQPTRVLSIERSDLLKAMRSNPDLAIGLMQNVAQIASSRLRNLQQELGMALSR